MLNITFSGTQVLLGTAMIVFLLFGIGFWGRRFFRHTGQGSPKGGSRTKYKAVDVFRHQPLFLRLGLICSLAFTFLAFNWTQFEARVLTDQVSLTDWDNEIDNAPPITLHPPPPPPPPPPPKFEAVIDPNLPDTTVFSSTDIGSNTAIAPATIKKPTPPKYVPPPPPIKKDEPEYLKFAEEMPVFGDCSGETDQALRKQCSDKAIITFISKNVRYPAMAKENGVSGTAVIRFIVEKDGSLSNIEMVRDPGTGLGTEAERVIQTMAQSGPTWTPGKQNGRKVRVQFNLPIRFRLE